MGGGRRRSLAPPLDLPEPRGVIPAQPNDARNQNMSRRCELTGKGVLVGNNVSHAQNKTRRRFLPNLHVVSLQSDALDRTVRLRVTSSALRTVEKQGGLDPYLRAADDRILSDRARRLKHRIEKASAATA